MSKDIKIGETYNLRVKVDSIDEDGWLKVRTSDKSISFILSPKETEAFSQLTKCDPCRLFRKGDKVQVKKRDGRCNGKDGEYLREAFCTVAEDETQNELVRVLHNATEYRLDPAYLELVTPVEWEPYSVVQPEHYKCVRIMEGKRIHSSIPFDEDECVCLTLEQALAAAEAERDRLNAEYRKEQK